MILIDSVYINNGGGFILLKYLVEKLEDSKRDVFYLFDDRTTDIFEGINSEKLFIPNSVYDRLKFYITNKNKFSSVLCFGNLPPPIKLSMPVYTYFHHPLLLKIPSSFSLTEKIIYTLKQKYLNLSKKNTDYWLVQSSFIEKEFSDKYLNSSLEKTKILPFYPLMDISTFQNVTRNKNSFVYVSNSVPHKNHEKLINAFCNAYDKVKCGSLMVTVPSTSTELCDLISNKVRSGYPLINVGFIDRDELIQHYLTHEYLIFPSLAESFGLGLAEAIDCGCKVLVSDLPYAYEVCIPSLTFDPYNIDSIENAILTAIEEHLPISRKVISNDINELIALITKKYDN